MNALSHFQSGAGNYPAPDFNAMRIRRVAVHAGELPPPPESVRSVLVMKLDGLGDYLLHTPFIAQLRQLYPRAVISWLCNRAAYELAALNPNLDHVIAAPYSPGQNAQEALLYGYQLQQHAAAPFDVVIVPRWHEDWHHAGIIAQTLDVPVRLSFSAASTPYKRENFPMHDDYFTHAVDETAPMHEVWRSMQLLHALGMAAPNTADLKIQLHVSEADEAEIQRALGSVSGRTHWVAFGIGGSGEFKRWPGTHFAELARKMLESAPNAGIILLGGAEDAEAAKIITAQNPSAIVNGIGRLSIRQSAAMLRHCHAAVCNDSFIMHAAAACGVPVVEITGQPADGRADSEYLPQCFGPWGVPFAWLQPQTCSGSKNIVEDFREEPKCIADVSPHAVWIAFTEVMQRWAKPV